MKNFTTNIKIEIPDYVKTVLQALKDNGFQAFVVGGSVRDAIMGKSPSDWDVCTSAMPEETEKVFSSYKTILVGKKYGTVAVISEGRQIEVTTYRVDGDYLDSRHPEAVSFTRNLNEDLGRRDFTMNAIAYSYEEGIIDPYGGASDIEKGIIRTVGDPEKRFEEDALRIMRGLRFASCLGFKIDKDTSRGMQKCKDGLKEVSRERINIEFNKLIMGEFSDQIFNEYREILETGIKGLRCNTIRKNLSKCPKNKAYRLSTIFDNGDTEALKNLKYDKDTIRLVEELWQLFKLQPKEDKIYLGKLLKEFEREAVELFYMGEGKEDYFLKTIVKIPCYSIKDLDIDGDDLIKLGVKRGPKIGETLNILLDQVIEGKVENKREDLKTLLDEK